MSYLFSFLRYQTKCAIKFLFRQLMMVETLWLIFDHLLEQWPTGRQREKEGCSEIQKIEYLENEKSFLHEIISISYSF